MNIRKPSFWTLGLMVAAALSSCCATEAESDRNALRAPAYPLVSIDPYTSAWSASDNLYDESVTHWTGKPFPLIGAIKIDDQVYRFMGVEDVDLVPVCPLSTAQPWEGTYVTSEPKGDWTSLTYDDSSWSKGPAGFGTFEYPSAKTLWDTEYVWVRRTVELDEQTASQKLYLLHSNDDGADFYINGVQIFHTGKVDMNVATPFSEEALKAVKPGINVISARCQDTGGWNLLDFGLMRQAEAHTVLEQTAVQTFADVQATRTIYGFRCGEVDLELTFLAPLFMDDLEVMSRPVNYISYKVKSKKAHKVSLYLEASPLWAADTKDQETISETFTKNGLTYVKAGTTTQNVLARKGDDIRIDWGWFHLAGEETITKTGIGSGNALRTAFAAGEDISAVGNSGKNADGRMALVQDLGKVSKASGKFLIGYDDVYSIQYFGDNLHAYWNKDGDKTITDAFDSALSDYKALCSKSEAFDAQLMAEATEAGGRKYAELCALAYRQSVHAHKLVESPQGDLLWLSKENNSNGSIGTVDVTYPSSPLFLLYNPALAEGLMNHIYYYSESGRWTKPFPSHDVGTYPLANGMTYGGDMPVEEAGNMISLTAAVCFMENSGEYAKKHWDVLTTWTEYLLEFGLDPDTQLCTDDFAGHFAHNVNLSVKAIIGIASYGYMAGLLGDEETSAKYIAKAKEMAAEWVKMADDGDHFRLTFDKEGTWSQKYNLIWDKVLGLGIFPDEVRQKEIAYYLGIQNEYGLPLDNRKTYTKTDWILWTATLADSMEDFQAFIDPVYKFMDETEDRVPMSDWVFTDEPVHQGFKARSVVGGYFMKMLDKKINEN